MTAYWNWVMNRAVYAEALFSLEKYRQVNPDFSLAADGNKPWLLMERIRRVLGKPTQRKKQISPLLLLSLAAAFILFCPAGKTHITRMACFPGSRAGHSRTL